MTPINRRSPAERGTHFAVSENDRVRFSRRLTPGSCGCIEWRGSSGSRGYGAFRPDCGKGRVVAHRFAYAARYGPIPTGFVVCHSCDNRRCVNPDHLFLGTMSDNTKDAVAKGRMTGIRSPVRLAKSRKLTDTQVREIRAASQAGAVSERLGPLYGVDPSTIRQIVRRKIWKHL